MSGVGVHPDVLQSVFRQDNRISVPSYLLNIKNNTQQLSLSTSTKQKQGRPNRKTNLFHNIISKQNYGKNTSIINQPQRTIIQLFYTVLIKILVFNKEKEK